MLNGRLRALGILAQLILGVTALIVAAVNAADNPALTMGLAGVAAAAVAGIAGMTPNTEAKVIVPPVVIPPQPPPPPK